MKLVNKFIYFFNDTLNKIRVLTSSVNQAWRDGRRVE